MNDHIEEGLDWLRSLEEPTCPNCQKPDDIYIVALYYANESRATKGIEGIRSIQIKCNDCKYQNTWYDEQ